MRLNREHFECVARQRRLLNHYDANFFNYRTGLLSAGEFAEVVLDFTRFDEFRFDTVLWDVDGAMACYPSRFIPHYPGMKDWLDAGNDFLPDVVSRSRDLGLEVFFSFRVNSGQDPNFTCADGQAVERSLIRRHPYSLEDNLCTEPVSRQTAENLEVRVNNLRLTLGGIVEGWLAYPVRPIQLASGTNLIMLRLEDDFEAVSIEKIELDLDRWSTANT